jgi:hypothetical protein
MSFYESGKPEINAALRQCGAVIVGPAANSRNFIHGTFSLRKRRGVIRAFIF